MECPRPWGVDIMLLRVPVSSPEEGQKGRGTFGDLVPFSLCSEAGAGELAAGSRSARRLQDRKENKKRNEAFREKLRKARLQLDSQLSLTQTKEESCSYKLACQANHIPVRTTNGHLTLL